MSVSSSEDYNLSAILCKEDEHVLLQDQEVQRYISSIVTENDGLLDIHLYCIICPQNDFEDFKPDIQDQNFLIQHIYPLIETIEPVLSNDEYPGPYEFDVCIVPNNSKNPWEYSIPLNKIYIDINNYIPVDFSLKNRPRNVPLHIRATPTFAQPQHSQEFVYRCINHEHPKDPTNKDIPEHVCQHVIRCHNQTTKYLGDRHQNRRLSLVFPLTHPQAGSNFVREMFQFVCKSSCPGGMNRKPIEVIFTLEDLNGKILGRRAVCVRICSCPKRDKDKEERALEKTEKNEGPNKGKKRKMLNEKSKPSSPVPENDMIEYSLENVKVIGKHNYLNVLKYCHDIMSGEIIKNEGKVGMDLPYRKCLNGLNAQINKLAE